MTLINDIQKLTTPAKHLLTSLYEAMADMIEVPNSVLPDRLHGRYNGRSCSELQRPPKLSDKEQAKLDAAEREVQKAIRIESYVSDECCEREIQYLEDDDRLYRNQITFANLMEIEFE